MGVKMVTQTADASKFLTCTADADCYKDNSSLSEAVATTDAEKKLRCCIRTELMVADTTTAGKDEVTSKKGKGWSSEVKTYTKICDYSYAS